MLFKSQKLIGTILVSLIFSFGLSGCATKTESKTEDNTVTVSTSVDNATSNPLKIATSFYPMYIFTLNVAKDIPNVAVVNMTKSTIGCLHDYVMTPDDLKNLEGAKIFIINGAGTESFLSKVTDQMPNLKIIESSKGIQLIKGAGDEGDNAHVWVSISNAITQVNTIGEQLALLDPEHANKYKENTLAYIKKLELERDKMHQALDNLENRDIITFHEAFPYFAKEFNLTVVSVIEREPGSEPSAKDLADTIDQVKNLKVKALFAEPQYPKKAADTIASATGAKVYTLDPVVTGPDDIDAYINIMDSNLKTLQEALK